MTERDTPELPEEEPTPPWLRDALDAPVSIDASVRDQHLRAALAAYDEQMTPDGSADRSAEDLAPVRPLDAARRRRASTSRWLGVAAAALVVVGVGGYWLAETDSSSVGTADQVAGSAETTRSAPAAPESGVAQDAAGSRELATAQGGDLGAFATDAELRDALRAGIAAETSKAARPTVSTTVAPTLPTTSPPGPATRPSATTGAALGADAATPSCLAPPVPPGTTVTPFTATVGGVPVQVWVIGSGESAAVTVFDAATCTVRPG